MFQLWWFVVLGVVVVFAFVCFFFFFFGGWVGGVSMLPSSALVPEICGRVLFVISSACSLRRIQILFENSVGHVYMFPFTYFVKLHFLPLYLC